MTSSPRTRKNYWRPLTRGSGMMRTLLPGLEPRDPHLSTFPWHWLGVKNSRETGLTVPAISASEYLFMFFFRRKF